MKDAIEAPLKVDSTAEGIRQTDHFVAIQGAATGLIIVQLVTSVASVRSMEGTKNCALMTRAKTLL